MSRVFKLSKSKLLAYRQCPKRLWLQTHRPELAEVDDATLTIMASGTNAGEVFRSLYADGVLIDTDTLGEALSMTRDMLRAPRKTFSPPPLVKLHRPEFSRSPAR